MVTVFSLTIPGSVDRKVFDLLLSHLSPEAREKILRRAMERDRQCSLWAEVLVRCIACSALDLRNTDLVFTRNAFGKPCLKDRPGFHFNVSHSGDKVLCGFGNRPLGVDIEIIRGRNQDIAGRFFSAAENDWLMRQRQDLRSESFIDIWTLKESYLKALGKGISKGLDTFTIQLDDGPVTVVDNEDEQAGALYNFRRYAVGDGYKAAVCSPEKDLAGSIVEKTCDELYKDFLRYT